MAAGVLVNSSGQVMIGVNPTTGKAGVMVGEAGPCCAKCLTLTCSTCCDCSDDPSSITVVLSGVTVCTGCYPRVYGPGESWQVTGTVPDGTYTLTRIGTSCVFSCPIPSLTVQKWTTNQTCSGTATYTVTGTLIGPYSPSGSGTGASVVGLMPDTTNVVLFEGRVATSTGSGPCNSPATYINFVTACQVGHGGFYAVGLGFGGTAVVTYPNHCPAPTISPTTLTVGAGTSTALITVTQTTGCAWKAVNNVNWIGVINTAPHFNSGCGNGSFQISVTANNCLLDRTGTVTVCGTTLTVTQAGTCPGGTLTFSPNPVHDAGNGGTYTITVTASSGTCRWDPTTAVYPSWIALYSGSAQAGNGSFQITVAANSGAASRSATITLCGQSYVVNQDGGCPNSTDILSCPASITLTVSGTGTCDGTFTLARGSTSYAYVNFPTEVWNLSCSTGGGSRHWSLASSFCGTFSTTVPADASGCPTLGTYALTGGGSATLS